MNRQYFAENVIMAVEIESDSYGRHWTTMKNSEVDRYLENLSEDEGLSDIDYCTRQEDPEIGKVLEKAYKIFDESRGTGKFNSISEAIDMVLGETEKKRRVWTEDEIKNLIQTNDKVLYGALRKLYAEQTSDEQAAGTTKHYNGVGFNGADAKIMSSFAEFLKRTGFLTPKQKAVARRKLVKYNKQLTRIANA